MRANLADKHELVVTGCPLCNFNALSAVNGGQVTLVTEGRANKGGEGGEGSNRGG